MPISNAGELPRRFLFLFLHFLFSQSWESLGDTAVEVYDSELCVGGVGGKVGGVRYQTRLRLVRDQKGAGGGSRSGGGGGELFEVAVWRYTDTDTDTGDNGDTGALGECQVVRVRGIVEGLAATAGAHAARSVYLLHSLFTGTKGQILALIEGLALAARRDTLSRIMLYMCPHTPICLCAYHYINIYIYIIYNIAPPSRLAPHRC
jgi:hypothetical protein